MADKPKRNVIAAAYAVTYEKLHKIAYSLGWALTLHGSMQRDMDLVAIPWDKFAVPAEKLVDELVKGAGGTVDETMPRPKPHGRLCWTIQLGGEPYIDLSVMPRVVVEQGSVNA